MIFHFWCPVHVHVRTNAGKSRPCPPAFDVTQGRDMDVTEGRDISCVGPDMDVTQEMSVGKSGHEEQAIHL